jgi:hypothetical protein
MTEAPGPRAAELRVDRARGWMASSPNRYVDRVERMYVGTPGGGRGFGSASEER